MNKPIFPLYLITANCLDKDFEKKIILAIKGGVSCIQLRDKELNKDQLLNIAKKLRRITNHYHIPLIINDDLSLVDKVKADGLHLGQCDIPWQVAREILGPNKIIGLSIENIDQAKENINADVDYFGVGPIFKTQSKKDAAPEIGYDGLKEISNILSHKPLIAIGGITHDNFQALIKLKPISGIAIISSILNAYNPKDAAICFKRYLP
ncbi:thiamine phosphate synthase [Thiotrichales bacterium 19S11-10]|nr:thiamine phosphate synthase [Thiotrichales bacterium 19S11-10]